MAEIRVERKHNPLWMWIVGVVLLLLMIWGLAGGLQRERTQVDTGTAEVDITSQPQPPIRLPVA